MACVDSAANISNGAAQFPPSERFLRRLRTGETCRFLLRHRRRRLVRHPFGRTTNNANDWISSWRPTENVSRAPLCASKRPSAVPAPNTRHAISGSANPFNVTGPTLRYSNNAPASRCVAEQTSSVPGLATAWRRAARLGVCPTISCSGQPRVKPQNAKRVPGIAARDQRRARGVVMLPKGVSLAG
jgi:hypothetical protein